MSTRINALSRSADVAKIMLPVLSDDLVRLTVTVVVGPTVFTTRS